MSGLLRRMLLRLRRERRGVTSLEFALAAVPLGMLMFGVVEIGMAVRVKSALQYATTQAARCTVVNTALCGSADAAQTYAVSQAMGVTTAKSTFTVANAACGSQVSASVAFPVVAHKVFPTSLTLSASACYPR